MNWKSTIALALSLSLLGVVQLVSSATAAPTVCKKAGIASVNTSEQILYSGDSLRVTFRGIGGGCDLGNFKVIVSSSSDVNKQGYISGIESNVALSAYPSGSDTDYQRVTYTHQISDSDKGKFFQYFFVTSSGVKVRSVIVEVSENS